MTKFTSIAATLFFLSFNLSVAQTQNLDSLIQNIDNKDAYIVLVKTMSPRISGDAANGIVRIGKQATPGLIKILDNKNKGIIAHFILSEIWKDQWTEENCCDISTFDDEEIVVINGLEIHIKNNVLSATTDAMDKNKLHWKKVWQV